MSPRGIVSSCARALCRSRGTISSRRRASATRQRPLAAEPLESRAMLSTNAELSSNISMFARIPVMHGTREANPAGNFVGQFSWRSVSGAAAAVGVRPGFNSFCVEGQQSISPGQHTFPTLKSLSTSGLANAGLVEQFWRRYGPTAAQGFTNVTDAAAFQLGIWELISDGTATDLASGSFKVANSTAPAVARAASWLKAWSEQTGAPAAGAGGTVALYVLQHPTKQDQVVWVPVPPPPLPTVTVQASPASVEEDGSAPLVYTFTASAPLTSDITVSYTIGGSATAGSDCTGVPPGAGTGMIRIPAGSSSATLTITPTPDALIEPDETVVITLLDGTGYAIGLNSIATGMILNDDCVVDLTIDDLPVDIEDGSGAIIWRNSDFTRQIKAPDSRQTEPGVPRYVADYTNLTAIDPAFSTQFTKARATFTPGMAPGHDFRFVFQPAVTLWTRTEWMGFVQAADGWWKIPSGTDVRPKVASDERLDFWIEGLQTTGYAAGKLEFQAVPIAPTPIRQPPRVPPSDAATFTVLDAGLGVDGNRDGTIDFADSYDRQLTFWLNNDRDVEDDPGLFGLFDLYDQFGAPYETEDAIFAITDSADVQITTKRDLEDFAAVHFLADSTLTAQMSQSATATSTPGGTRPTYHLGLKLSADPPKLRLFRDRSQSGALDHVSNTDAASALVGGLAAEADIGSATTILQSLVQPDRDGRFRYLFEALGTAGKTTLEYTVTVTYPQSVGTSGQPRTTSRTHTLDLDLRDITDFYTRMQVPYRLANGVDARYAAFSPTDKVLPHFADAVPRAAATTAATPFLSGKGTVVLVHGWNMTDGTQTRGPATDWKKAFAETAFKRLYWQGFRGEIVAFDWPTFADSEGGPQGTTTENVNLSYNASEFQAFRSGQSLMNFLNGKQADGPVHLLAHSMGNVVAAEALRQWTVAGKAQPLVTSYTAMQGAISAGAYGDDTRDALDGAFGSPTSTTDYYRHWPTGVVGSDRSSMEGTGRAAGKWINMYNPVDAATSGDRFGWVANNLQKPLAGAIWRDVWYSQSFATAPRFAYRIDAHGRLLRSYATATGQWVSDGEIDLTNRLVAEEQGQQLPGLAAYEIMAFMAKANAKPIGTKVVDFFVRNNGTNINIRSLGLSDTYADEWSGHSFQFHFDAATTSQFWQRVVDETGMATVRTPRAP